MKRKSVRQRMARPTPLAMRSMRSGSVARTAGLVVRMLPVISHFSGMTLTALPLLSVPMLTTTRSPGGISRLTTVCRAQMICAAATVGSTASCGRLPWPPLPMTSSSQMSPEVVAGPGVNWISPSGAPART